MMWLDWSKRLWSEGVGFLSLSRNMKSPWDPGYLLLIVLLMHSIHLCHSPSLGFCTGGPEDGGGLVLHEAWEIRDNLLTLRAYEVLQRKLRGKGRIYLIWTMESFRATQPQTNYPQPQHTQGHTHALLLIIIFFRSCICIYFFLM